MWKQTLMEYKFHGSVSMVSQRAITFSQKMVRRHLVHWNKVNVISIEISLMYLQSIHASKLSSIGVLNLVEAMSLASKFQLELFELTHSPMTYHKKLFCDVILWINKTIFYDDFFLFYRKILKINPVVDFSSKIKFFWCDF